MSGPSEALRAVSLRVGHSFGNPGLLVEALTHPSYRNEHPDEGGDNQRLEFLGDAVLGLAVAKAVFEAAPDAPEGVLTTVRARVVSAPVLAACGRAAGLGPALRLGKGVRAEGGAERDSVLSDAVEALIGAVFLDAGFDAAREVALALVAKPLAATLAAADSGGGLGQVHRHAHNWKTAVQEQLQAAGHEPPSYAIVATAGPPHNRTFTVEARASRRGRRVSGVGSGRSRKAAEHAAAHELLAALKPETPPSGGD